MMVNDKKKNREKKIDVDGRKEGGARIQEERKVDR